MRNVYHQNIKNQNELKIRVAFYSINAHGWQKFLRTHK
jgi:hypothetical protein